MRRTLLAKQPIKLAPYALLLAIVAPAFASDFAINDVVSEIEFVRGLAAGSLEPSTLSKGAREDLVNFSRDQVAGKITKSPLVTVCPTASVINNYGRQYQFRAKHEDGTMEWIITTPTDLGSRVERFVYIVIPDSGAPGIMPILPEGAVLLPPGNLCLKPTEVDRLKERNAEACSEYPELCPK